MNRLGADVCPVALAGLLSLLAGCVTPSPSPDLADRVLLPALASEQTEKVVARPGGVVAPPVAVERVEVPDEVPVFTLSAAIDFALGNNPRLRVARAGIGRALGEEQVAFSPFLPEVGFAYRYVAFASSVQPIGEGIPAVIGFGAGDRDFSQAELQLQWTLCDFGRTASRYGRAATLTQIAKLRAARAEQTVAYDVTAAYLRALLAQAVRKVQDQSLKRAEAILEDVKVRRRNGVADRDDELRASLQVSEAREMLVVAEQEEFNALAQFNNTMGRNAGLPLRLTDWTTRPDFGLALEDCLQVALAERRELAIAQDQVVAAHQGVEAARAEFRPRIYAKGVAARIDGSGVETEDVFGAGIHFDQKFYAGGRRRGETDAARADVDAAIASAQQVADGVSLEVNLAFRAIAAARERIKLAESAVTQATENLRLVRVKYRNGNATPTDVVDAETALTRSEQRQQSATYGYLAALARLDYAMGTPQGNLTCTAP